MFTNIYCCKGKGKVVFLLGKSEDVQNGYLRLLGKLWGNRSMYTSLNITADAEPILSCLFVIILHVCCPQCLILLTIFKKTINVLGAIKVEWQWLKGICKLCGNRCYSNVNRSLINITQKRWSADPAQTASTLIKGLTQTLRFFVGQWKNVD